MKKQIQLVKGYTELDYLPFLISTCRLKPAEVFNQKYPKLVLKVYKKWADEFGNYLYIDEYKSLNIVKNSINKKDFFSSDLYGGLNYKSVEKISDKVFIGYGEDPDIGEVVYYSLLGKDKYLRSFIYANGKWSKFSSLLLGLKFFKEYMEETEYLQFKEVNWETDKIFPLQNYRQWISYLPLPDELWEENKFNNLEKILKGIE